ncbi:MAG: 5-(carboxyamino)imidazole ribonucleotide mutase [Acidimicrobiia bacterium]|nr:5-(carboxyamino)imidazole ribonucleotide mutase [Acidimicrobiia bacterium]
MSAPVRVGVVMGSDSDWSVASAAVEVLDELGIGSEARVLSAHRTPHELLAYGEDAADRGLVALIGAAGGAAHLPGMLAAVTTLPVIGLPVPLSRLDGLDSLLSIVQMPAGIPVATVAIGAGRNAGLLAARIVGVTDPAVRAALGAMAADMVNQTHDKDARVLRSRADLLGVDPSSGATSAGHSDS